MSYDVNRSNFLLNFSSYAKLLQVNAEGDVYIDAKSLFKENTFYLDVDESYRGREGAYPGSTIQYPYQKEKSREERTTDLWEILTMAFTDTLPESTLASIFTLSPSKSSSARVKLEMKDVTRLLKDLMKHKYSMADVVNKLAEIAMGLFESILAKSYSTLAMFTGKTKVESAKLAVTGVFSFLRTVLWEAIKLAFRPILWVWKVFANSVVKQMIPYLTGDKDKAAAIIAKMEEASIADFDLSTVALFEKQTTEEKEFFVCFRESAGMELANNLPISNLFRFWSTVQQCDFLVDDEIGQFPECVQAGMDKNPLAWFNDLSPNDPYYRVRVHFNIYNRYYKLARRKYLPMLINRVKLFARDNPGKPIKVSLAGFSLGAAQATLAALDIKLHLPEVEIEAHTFACPRIGNRAFAQLFDRLIPNAFRIIKNEDMIPAYPPLYYKGDIAFGIKEPIRTEPQKEELMQNFTSLLYSGAYEPTEENADIQSQSFTADLMNILHQLTESETEEIKRENVVKDPDTAHKHYFSDYAHYGTNVMLYDSGCMVVQRYPVNESTDFSITESVGYDEWSWFSNLCQGLLDTVAVVRSKNFSLGKEISKSVTNQFAAFIGNASLYAVGGIFTVPGSLALNALGFDNAFKWVQQIAQYFMTLYNKASLSSVLDPVNTLNSVYNITPPAVWATITNSSVNALGSIILYVAEQAKLDRRNPMWWILNILLTGIKVTLAITGGGYFGIALAIYQSIRFVYDSRNILQYLSQHVMNSQIVMGLALNHDRKVYTFNLGETCAIVKTIQNAVVLMNRDPSLTLPQLQLDCAKDPYCVFKQPRLLGPVKRVLVPETAINLNPTYIPIPSPKINIRRRDEPTSGITKRKKGTLRGQQP